MTGSSKSRSRWWKYGLIGIVCLVGGGYLFRYKIMTQPWAWEHHIRQYESQDKSSFPPKGKILLIGSSSIRYWKTAARDLAPLPVINRGFGGAHVSHVHHFSKRILTPYEPRMIVLYAGENDIAAGDTTAQVETDLYNLLKHIHKQLPQTHVFYLSVKPSVLRNRYWAKMDAFNQRVKTRLKQFSYATFVDISAVMLTSTKQPDGSLFSWDRLHMNAKGYKRWTSVIRPILLRAWKQHNQPRTSSISPPQATSQPSRP